MKVVFLDFDGVLNSWRWFHDSMVRGAEARALLPHPDSDVDPKAVRWLNEIVSASGAKVVVSSTWRLRLTPPELQAILDRAGFEGEVIDRTPDHSWRKEDSGLYAARERGFEIAAWLAEHPEVTSFAILDDGSDMAHLKPNLVQTDVRKGLKPVHVEAALKLLIAVAPGAPPGGGEAPATIGIPKPAAEEE